MKIARTLSFLLLAGAFALASCGSPFTGTVLAPEVVSSGQAALNSGTLSTFTAADITISGIIDASTAAAQVLTITFDEDVDVATIPTALFIYDLANTVEPDGAPVRNGLVPYTLTETRRVGTSTIAYITLAGLNAPTPVSAILEIFIDPTILTARGGALRLNLDSDWVAGEDNDDDYLIYYPVVNGDACSANQRNPRMNLLNTWTVQGTAVGTTTWTWNNPHFTLDNSDYKALFDAIVHLERFGYADGTWTQVAFTTTTYNAGTGDYVVTFPAFVAGETYRIRYVDLQNRQTAKTLLGYNQKLVRDTRTEIVDTTFLHVADPNQVVLGDGDVTVSTVFNNSTSGYVQLNFAVGTIGTEGIQADTITAANVKILRSDNVLVPFTSVVVRKSAVGSPNKNDQVLLVLDPAYKNSGHTFNVLIGPGVKMLGSTTSTTDDRIFGDPAVTVKTPYGFLWSPGDGYNI